MAISIVSSQGLGSYRADRDSLSPVQLFKLAQGGDESCCKKLGGFPDFIVSLVATTDTSNMAAVDLTDEGVLFPANSVRTIRGRSYCSTDNDHYWYEWEQEVFGNDGTTPVLGDQRILDGGGEENGTAVAYGDVHFRATLGTPATPNVDFASAGLAIAAITSGAADFTVPPNRLCLVKNAMMAGAIGTASAQASKVTVNVANLDGAGSGTDAVQFWDNTSSADIVATNPAADANTFIDLAFEMWPAHNHRLVLNSTAVEVQCTAVDAIADDDLRHRVEIFVGPVRQLQVQS